MYFLLIVVDSDASCFENIARRVIKLDHVQIKASHIGCIVCAIYLHVIDEFLIKVRVKFGDFDELNGGIGHNELDSKPNVIPLRIRWKYLLHAINTNNNATNITLHPNSQLCSTVYFDCIFS